MWEPVGANVYALAEPVAAAVLAAFEYLATAAYYYHRTQEVLGNLQGSTQVAGAGRMALSEVRAASRFSRLCAAPGGRYTRSKAAPPVESLPRGISLEKSQFCSELALFPPLPNLFEWGRQSFLGAAPVDPERYSRVGLSMSS